LSKWGEGMLLFREMVVADEEIIADE